jgi:uncharacterized protein
MLPCMGMQDSGRKKNGQFAPGHTGNPNGRAGKSEPRMDGDDPAEQMDPSRAMNIVRIDGWQNAATGMGVPGYDKRLGSRFVNAIVSYTDLVELWRGDDICARVIETLPKEALQKGYELNIADEGDYGDLKDQVEQTIDELEINDNLRTSLMQERAYGGSALLIGANDGQDMSMPLAMERITELLYVTPLEPYEITPLKSYDDRNHPKYGKPELYQLNAISQASAGMADPMARCLPSTSVIHETRLIIFPGIRVSKFQSRSSVSGVYWGDSVLNRVIQVVADFNMGFASTGIILTEQGLPIFHMKELAKLVNANRLDIVRARLSLLFQQMSTARAAVIDSEENYERKAMPLTGLSDVLDRLCTRLAAAVSMPVTKLMGQSPKGLGNEGDSDMEQWYDQVASYQDEKIRKPLRKLIQIVMAALGVQEPAKWNIEFSPLVQQSDKEQADARQVQMTIDTGYLQSGVLTVDEIRNSRFSGKYSHETQLDPDAWAAMNATNQPLTPEDMMAMGLDPNNPEHVAQAQQMQAEQAAMGGMPGMGGEPDPEQMAAMGLDPNNPEDVAQFQAQMAEQAPEGEVDPETGEPVAAEAEIDPETGEPVEPELDPETGEPVAKMAAAPGAPGAKPSPFGKPVGGPPGMPGAKPGGPPKPGMPGAKPSPFGGPPKPGTKPGEEPVEGEEPKGKVLPFGKKPTEGEEPEGKGEGEGKGAVPFGKKPAAEGGKVPLGKEAGEAEPEVDPETGEPVEPEEGQEKPGNSLFANSERGAEKPLPPGEPKDGGRGRSGETDEDRQRMSSQRPGIPTHLRDVNGDGKVSPEEAAMSIDDLLSAIDSLKKSMGAGGMVPGDTLEKETQLRQIAEEGGEEAEPEIDPETGEPLEEEPVEPGEEGEEPVEGEPEEEEAAKKKPLPFGRRDEWNEEDHPRDENGRFGAGGSGRTPTERAKVLSAHRAMETVSMSPGKTTSGPSYENVRHHQREALRYFEAAQKERGKDDDYSFEREREFQDLSEAHEILARASREEVWEAENNAEVDLMRGNFGIKRGDMPQFERGTERAFLGRLEERGHKVHYEETHKVSDIKATQATLHMKTVRNMSIENQKSPIIISSDGYVLDGHHRWAAVKLRNPEGEITAHRVALPIQTLLTEALNDPYSTRTDDDEE